MTNNFVAEGKNCILVFKNGALVCKIHMRDFMWFHAARLANDQPGLSLRDVAAYFGIR